MIQTAKQYEEHLKQRWNNYCATCHPDDWMSYTDFIHCVNQPEISGWQIINNKPIRYKIMG